jgi:hypothetical protein
MWEEMTSAAIATGVVALALLVAAPGRAQGPQPQAPAQTVPTQPRVDDPTTFLPFVYGPLEQRGMEAPARNRQGKVHLLPATPATTQWGWFDNAQPPVLRIHAGDTVVMETMMHSHNQVVPGVTIEQVKRMRTD